MRAIPPFVHHTTMFPLLAAYVAVIHTITEAEKTQKEGLKKDGSLLLYRETLKVDARTNHTLLSAEDCVIHVPRSSTLMLIRTVRCKITFEKGARVKIIARDLETTLEEVDSDLPVNCTNCGAVVQDDGTCGYCGSNHN